MNVGVITGDSTVLQGSLSHTDMPSLTDLEPSVTEFRRQHLERMRAANELFKAGRLQQAKSSTSQQAKSNASKGASRTSGGSTGAKASGSSGVKKAAPVSQPSAATSGANRDSRSRQPVRAEVSDRLLAPTTASRQRSISRPRSASRTREATAHADVAAAEHAGRRTPRRENLTHPDAVRRHVKLDGLLEGARAQLEFFANMVNKTNKLSCGHCTENVVTQ
jgi:hypothetical protein